MKSGRIPFVLFCFDQGSFCTLAVELDLTEKASFMTKKLLNSRRDFLKKNVLLAGTVAMAGFVKPVHAAGADTLKIGLIGCGGRGCGAVADAMKCGEANLELVAVADIFKEKAESGLKLLRDQFEDQVKVTPETTFSGFDGYKSVIEAADVVFLCSPQLFRPMMLEDAIAAGKHVFCEKPVAVDAPGIQSVLKSAELAKQKGLNIVTGLINRYSVRVRDAVNRVLGGQIGSVVTARADRMGGPLWTRPRLEGDTEILYQMRNWVNFDWISAEYINDVTIHQLDVAMWCMGDEFTPVRAFATGGRLVRTEPDTGDLYDSMAVTYEYEDGRPLYAFSRQIPGTYGSASAFIAGSKGTAEIGNVGWGKVAIYGQEPYEIPKDSGISPYAIQHGTLVRAIRGGDYVNHLPYTAKATMAAILGKMAAYSGQQLTWDEAFQSDGIIDPRTITWDTIPPTLPNASGEYKTALPGK